MLPRTRTHPTYICISNSRAVVLLPISRVDITHRQWRSTSFVVRTDIHIYIVCTIYPYAVCTITAGGYCVYQASRYYLAVYSHTDAPDFQRAICISIVCAAAVCLSTVCVDSLNIEFPPRRCINNMRTYIFGAKKHPHTHTHTETSRYSRECCVRARFVA